MGGVWVVEALVTYLHVYHIRIVELDWPVEGLFGLIAPSLTWR